MYSLYILCYTYKLQDRKFNSFVIKPISAETLKIKSEYIEPLEQKTTLQRPDANAE